MTDTDCFGRAEKDPVRPPADPLDTPAGFRRVVLSAKNSATGYHDSFVDFPEVAAYVCRRCGCPCFDNEAIHDHRAWHDAVSEGDAFAARLGAKG